MAPSPVVQEMAKLMTDFAALVGGHGLDVKAYAGERPAYFAGLEPTVQNKVLSRFRQYVDVCQELAATGVSLHDDRQLLWCMIKKLGLRPSSELFSTLAHGDVVEIYDCAEMVQLYRNLRFYDVCSYSLDDVLSRPWFELYRRDEAVMQKVQDAAGRAIASRSTSIVHYAAGVHEMEEIDSVSMNRNLVENRFLAPLVDAGGQAQAVVNVIRPISLMSRRAGAAASVPSLELQH